jgi:hypothetical protein
MHRLISSLAALLVLFYSGVSPGVSPAMAQTTEGETRVIPPPPRQVDPDDNTKTYQADQDPIDPESAHDPKTGQNLHWDCIKKTWVDSKTGKPMGLEGTKDSDGEVIPPPPRQVDPDDNTKTYHADQDPINPESAHDPKTGQNLHWDRKDKTWEDSKTGKAMGLKGAKTKKKCPEEEHVTAAPPPPTPEPTPPPATGHHSRLSPISHDATGSQTAQVRISREDGLATASFQTDSGGRISAFLPLNVQQNEAEIGGTVERQLPARQANFTPGQIAEATAELSGLLTIKPVDSQSAFTSISCSPDKPSFTCPATDNRTYLVTYQPPNGPPCTATVECPAMPPPPVSNTCGIPQLTSCNGNMHVSMPCTSGDPKINSCDIGGKPATCRAWSSEGCVFHVPPASELPPGPEPVTVSRGKQKATGQTHVAQIKMTCIPSHLKEGQPCQVTTTVFCPGLQDVRNGVLVIKNYNPTVLTMPDKVLPITGK